MPNYIRGAVAGSIRKGSIVPKKTRAYKSGSHGAMANSSKGARLNKDSYRKSMNSAGSHTSESERGN